MNNRTTMNIPRELKEELDKLKVHPKQPYYEVIEMLLKYYKEEKDE